MWETCLKKARKQWTKRKLGWDFSIDYPTYKFLTHLHCKTNASELLCSRNFAPRPHCREREVPLFFRQARSDKKKGNDKRKGNGSKSHPPVFAQCHILLTCGFFFASRSMKYRKERWNKIIVVYWPLRKIMYNNTNLVLPVFHVQKITVIILHRYNDCVHCLRTWYPKNVIKRFVRLCHLYETWFKNMHIVYNN